MRKMWKMMGIVGAAFMMVACGEKVEVPPGSVAKIYGSQGYKEGIRPTSKFRLDPCWSYCDKIVYLQASDTPRTERIELFMPKDKLNVVFDVRMTLVVNPQKYEELFNRIPPVASPDGTMVINSDTAYNTYASQIIRSEAREFLSEYTIAEVASNREMINTELSKKLSASINSKTPFQVRYVGLADIKFPEIIVTAQEKAAERREAIQQEEAQLEVAKVRAERQLQEAQLQRKIDVEKAEAEAKVNKILADSVTPEYVKYRNLEILEKLSESENKVFIPMGMLDSVAGQTMVGRQ